MPVILAWMCGWAWFRGELLLLWSGPFDLESDAQRGAAAAGGEGDGGEQGSNGLGLLASGSGSGAGED